ncbi:N-acetyltransferase [Longimycelium tulufanense]|uniref:N-acetyltransferase n=1 Tax=Longimycelium tulufanense TaxID=907463 RepID=A0A8J3CEA5_9PSEU|nr:GNAT family N-acetyltransferase [Longimycelium tulufanense]GGM47652.1 N-acetyltransferase [Longimycelium tulufanense]
MIKSLARARRATADDLPAIVGTLTKAYAGYPWMSWTIAADDHHRRLRAFQLLFTEQIAFRFGEVWIAHGGSAVAVWTPPDAEVPDHVMAEYQARAEEIQGERAAVAAASQILCRPHRPQEPHWFLGPVAVQPKLQGRGLGRAVLKPGLAAADEQWRPCYLETSSERNLRLYRHLNFQVTKELTMPGGGPRVWCMRRDPQPTKISPEPDESTVG